MLMKKEWNKPSIIDFSNSNINSGADATATPESTTRCVDGMEATLMAIGNEGPENFTTFDTCS